MEGAASFKKMGEQLAKMWKGTVMSDFYNEEATYAAFVEKCCAIPKIDVY